MTGQDMRAADAVQDARQAALDALAAENGVERGDGPEVPAWSIWHDDAAKGSA
jgi:hypothetical protein